jgi:hypothetical protein
MFQKTRDLSVVQTWINRREAKPAVIKDTNILKIQFKDPVLSQCDPEDILEPISWQEFCKIFKKSNLLFLYEPNQNSEFYKIIFVPKASAET